MNNIDQIIYAAREHADLTATDGDWQDVVDSEIERLSDTPEIAEHMRSRRTTSASCARPA